MPRIDLNKVKLESSRDANAFHVQGKVKKTTPNLISAVIEDDTLERFTKLRHEYNLSKSALLRQMVEFAIDHLEDK
jgi:hypothetical protein